MVLVLIVLDWIYACGKLVFKEYIFNVTSNTMTDSLLADNSLILVTDQVSFNSWQTEHLIFPLLMKPSSKKSYLVKQHYTFQVNLILSFWAFSVPKNYTLLYFRPFKSSQISHGSRAPNLDCCFLPCLECGQSHGYQFTPFITQNIKQQAWDNL